MTIGRSSRVGVRKVKNYIYEGNESRSGTSCLVAVSGYGYVLGRSRKLASDLQNGKQMCRCSGEEMGAGWALCADFVEWIVVSLWILTSLSAPLECP